MLRRSLALAVVAAACGSGSSSLSPEVAAITPVDAAMIDSMDAREIEVDAGVDAVPVPAFVIPNDYVPAKGKRAMLVRDKAVAVGHGLRVTITEQGHKHLVGGGAVGFFKLKLQRGGRTLEIRFSASDETDESELDALGVLVVLKDTNDGIEITAVGRTPRPLDEEKAAEMIVKAAEKHGLPVGDASYGIENGVMTYGSMENGVSRWRARVGIYTRRMWFLPPILREPETGL